MLVVKSYDRERALMYAQKWVFSQNPLFGNFRGIGGNCTNFVSQSIYAGACVMNETPTFGWYYRSADDRAPAWSGVEQLYDFLTGSGDFQDQLLEGPFATVATNRTQVEIGDVVQLANSSEDFYHTLIISALDGNEIFVCAHSDDALDRPLSSYPYASLRVLHVMGCALELPTDNAFDLLISAEGLVTLSATETDAIKE